MKQRTILLLVVIGSVLAVTSYAAAGTQTRASSQSAASVCDTGHVHFAKTKFVFHAGLAFGVFHRYIYKPYRAGSFAKGAPGRTKALLKAGAAGLFVVHELKEACQDANSSDLLRPLLKPFNLIVTEFNVLVARIKGGHINAADFKSAESAVGSLGSKSAHLGIPIKDLTTGFGG